MDGCLRREVFVRLRKINPTKMIKTFTKIMTRRVSGVEKELKSCTKKKLRKTKMKLNKAASGKHENSQ